MVFQRRHPRLWSKQPSAQHTASILLLLSDSISIGPRFYRGRSRDFRVLTQIRRFASVCLARNIRIRSTRYNFTKIISKFQMT